MSDDDNNIVSLSAAKKTFSRFTVDITYLDKTKEEIECTFFGVSLDSPNFMVFSNAHPDAEEDSYPDILVNTDVIKKLKVKDVKQVER